MYERRTLMTMYRSRVDRWVLIVLLATAGICVAAVVGAVRAGSAPWPATLLLLGLGALLPLWLLDTRYVLGDYELRVRSGPFRWRVPLADIRQVVQTRTLLAGPALSLQRLIITYGAAARLVVISPRDMQAFLSDLEARRRAL